jgi:hypothetical protein
MYFNIIITTNDLIFFLCMVPILMVFSVMFKDWLKDRH